MDGREATEINKDTIEAYRKGKAMRAKPDLRRKEKIRNQVVAFIAIKMDIPNPKPIFGLLEICDCETETRIAG